MSHEPECPEPKCSDKCPGYSMCDHYCICENLRAAYKRGRDDAAKAIAPQIMKAEEFVDNLFKTLWYAARGGEQE